jgi:hypothetical protein
MPERAADVAEVARKTESRFQRARQRRQPGDLAPEGSRRRLKQPVSPLVRQRHEHHTASTGPRNAADGRRAAAEERFGVEPDGSAVSRQFVGPAHGGRDEVSGKILRSIELPIA